jgi:hypothetical protein
MAWQPEHATPLVLFHGTTAEHATSIVNQGVRSIAPSRPLDFGPGFYTTTIRKQAVGWANSVASRSVEAKPAVLRIAVTRQQLVGLATLALVSSLEEAGPFWQFIVHCRASIVPQHHFPAPGRNQYDVVFGPVARQWTRRPFEVIPGADQVSFHTSNGFDVLNAAIQSNNAAIET